MWRLSVLKRLTVLREDADKAPIPQRKFFHIGEAGVLEALGECIPMMPCATVIFSRCIVGGGPSSTWGKSSLNGNVRPLLKPAVKRGVGVLLTSSADDDHSLAQPGGKGERHLI